MPAEQQCVHRAFTARARAGIYQQPPSHSMALHIVRHPQSAVFCILRRVILCLFMPRMGGCQRSSVCRTFTARAQAGIREREEVIGSIFTRGDAPPRAAATAQCSTRNMVNITKRNTLRYIKIHYNALRYIAIHYHTPRYNTPHYNTPHYNTPRCAKLHGNALHNTTHTHCAT